MNPVNTMVETEDWEVLSVASRNDEEFDYIDEEEEEEEAEAEADPIIIADGIAEI